MSEVQTTRRTADEPVEPSASLSGLLAEPRERWYLSPVPLVFLAGMVFEVFLALQHEGPAEITLNALTVGFVLGWAGYRIHRRTLPLADPLLVIGACVLFAGAGGRLTGLFPHLLPELSLKTGGAILIVFALDRMERRRVTRTLEDTEEFLGTVFQSIPDPLLISDDAQVVAANPVATDLFGVDVIGRSLDELAPPGSHEGSDGEGRTAVMRIDGRARRYDVTASPLALRGKTTGLRIQQWRDVTAQHEAQQHARLLADAVQSVRDPMLVIGLDGDVRHANRAAQEWSERGASIRHARQLPFRHDRDRETFLIALRDWGLWEREVEMDAADGSMRVADLKLSPIRDGEGCVLGSVVFLRDVTELKSLQIQLVQNEKLGALGQLVAGVAHELNNPLTAVFGFAQLLLSDDLSEGTKSQVRHIYTHAERCKKIIDGLLRFGRSHRGDKHRANLNEVVEGAVDLLKYPLRLADVELEVSLTRPLPDSMMDPFQLQQVFVNLVTNAQASIEEQGRGGRIRLRTRIGVEGLMVAEVEDDGAGMSAEVQNRIFDPFFTTKDIGKGTGLGLSLSYGIVRDHGGRLTVRSRPGMGTTFRMELPVVAPPVSDPELRPVQPMPETEARRLRLLVVDDEPVICELLEQMLCAEGHEVVTVPGGEEALACEAEAPFDGVFSDWRMPEVSGQELYGELVRREPRYEGRVVFTTGDTLDTEVARLARRSGNRLINKPFSIDVVRDALAHLQRVPDSPCASV